MVVSVRMSVYWAKFLNTKKDKCASFFHCLMAKNGFSDDFSVRVIPHVHTKFELKKVTDVGENAYKSHTPPWMVKGEIIVIIAVAKGDSFQPCCLYFIPMSKLCYFVQL